MDIFKNRNIKRYDSTAGEVKFLLGGIGTGNLSIGSRGELADFEFFNEPSKGRMLPYTFFALYSRFQGEKSNARVLEARRNEPYRRPLGYASNELAGLPRFTSGKLSAAYPFVREQLFQEGLPLEVTLTAFTPFIPLDSFRSGLPAAYLTYRVKNMSEKACDVSVCGSFANPVAFNGYDLFHNMLQSEDVENTEIATKNLRGVYFTSKKMDTEARYFGNMALMTPSRSCTVKPEWVNGAWWDGAHEFWDDFSADGKLESETAGLGEASAFDAHSRIRIGSLCISQRLAPGEEAEFPFILSWYFPNRPNRWEGHLLPTKEHKKKQIIKNFYAYRFRDALDVADYMQTNRGELTDLSEKFACSMLSSTLPPEVLDAVLSTLTVIRSTTCFRVNPDGQFLAWEGCFDNRGSCEGNCTHVWNYAQSLAFLFPDLERSMRRTEFLQETDDEGCMTFRTNTVFGDPRWDMIPATDGQLGCVIRLYRDWKFSGDTALLTEVWPKAKKALEFAFGYWDSDGDSVLDSRQHNTYDIEFYGPNSLSNSIFFAALAAGAEMAEYLGDAESAAKWRAAGEIGSARMDDLLWNGEYYEQVIDDVDRFKYQYGKGCLSDQVFGQLLAHVTGLGYVLPEEHVKQAVQSVYRYNFREDLSEHVNVQRCYALNGESGLLICSWPHGGRPRFPFVYSDEVWTGIEYQVAAHLIYEGYPEEGLSVVRAVRSRYSGKDRNPFNEVECGNHYARSLASYAVYLALTGYRCDLVRGEISFAPKTDEENFQCFFSTGKGWGVYHRERNADGTIRESIETLFGDHSGVKLKGEKEHE